MIEIRFRVDSTQADAFFTKLDAALGDLSGAMSNVREEVRDEIDGLFTGYGRGHWADWSPWTHEWRDRPPQFLPNYYATHSGSVGGKAIGEWTGQLSNAFAGDAAPGYSVVTPDSMEMGVRDPGVSDWKYRVFVSGRNARAKGPSYYAFFKSLLERSNRGDLERDAIRRSDRRRRGRTPGSSGQQYEDAGEFVETTPSQKARAWRVHSQVPRPIYENLNLTSDSPEWNPIARGFRQWFREELAMTESFV